MFHAFDVVTNTKGDSLVGYQVALRAPDTGAIVPIFADDAGTPISVVSGIVNVALTDGAGNYDFFVPFGTYNIEVRGPDAVLLRTIESVPFNSGSQGGKGDTGPADNTYDDLATFKASDIARATASLVGVPNVPDGRFNWTLAQPGQPFVADDRNIIKADSTPLSTGAWVRQGADGVTYKGRAPGIIRSVQELLREGVKLKGDFDAKGDGRRVLKPDGTPDEANFVGTDDTAAIKDWLAEGVGNGFATIAERGTYLMSDTARATITTAQQQPSVNGAGLALTEFVQLNKAKDAIQVIGNMPRRDLFAMSGFKITYPDSWGAGLPTGRALTVENVRSLVMDGIRTFRSALGFNLVGCLDVQMRELVTFYDFVGMKLERGTYESFPNAISLDRCEIQASYRTGIEIVGGCAITVDGATTIENVGVENTNPSGPLPGGAAGPSGRSTALVLTESGFAGSVAIAGRGLYFEANRDYNIYINHANRPALYKFDACNFNRFNDIRVVNDIVFDCQLGDVQTAPAVLDLRGCSFTGFNGYTPDANKKKIAFTTPNGYGDIEFLDDGVLYGEIEEIPEAPLKSRHPQMCVLQVGSVNGSIEPIPYPKGIDGLQGVRPLDPGIYGVYPVSRDVRFMSAQVQVIEGGTAVSSTVVRAKTPQREGESNEAFAARPNDYFLVKLYDKAGALVIGNFELTATGRN